MYQFFVESHQICDKTVTILGSDVNHIKNVLRMKVGEELSVSNGVDGKEYRCGIVSLDEECITCELRFVKEDGVELPSEVYLFQGLPKADKMELIIQKAVELGAEEIVPVEMHRCIVKLDEKKKAAKQARWQAIAEAAAKQSKRNGIPAVQAPVSFPRAMEMAGEMDLFLIPYENERGMAATRDALAGLKAGMSVGILIGPEGGFEPREVEAAQAAGGVSVSLGRRILRTETAAITAVGMCMLHAELLGCDEGGAAE